MRPTLIAWGSELDTNFISLIKFSLTFDRSNIFFRVFIENTQHSYNQDLYFSGPSLRAFNLYRRTLPQWNPVNTVTNGPTKIWPY